MEYYSILGIDFKNIQKNHLPDVNWVYDKAHCFFELVSI